ncbi:MULTISPECIES: hypothetical protein [unclassified Rhizobium]|uniref:hypothetical protein n=1 Tax=unclassified Rhizobium TaxID=2613769 RepID=UPI001ADC6279|nr:MULTISPECIES: hypothetical protein [unclassified Rhizobium]MBO9127658.1 hypothetical protein [Rhizobium sp. 16-488-2b]MBO9178120.1 hypothetical protein [Rhizobium sp. 16-488-2a]
MTNWRKDWYSIMGPIWIWVIFIIFTPFFVMLIIVNADVLPNVVQVAVQSVCYAMTIVLAPLAGLFDIAPPYVAKKEIDWRNRNSDELFENEVSWEVTPFLPPVLDRIRSTTGKKWKAVDRRTSKVKANQTSPVSTGSN